MALTRGHLSTAVHRQANASLALLAGANLTSQRWTHACMELHPLRLDGNAGP